MYSLLKPQVTYRTVFSSVLQFIYCSRKSCQATLIFSLQATPLFRLSVYNFQQPQPVCFFLTLVDAIPYEKPYNIACFICFLTYTSFFSIKSNVLSLIQPRSLSCEQRIVSMCVSAMVHIHGQVLRCDLSCFSKIFYDL